MPDLPDRIIAATALHLGLPLISRDRRIQAPGVEVMRDLDAVHLASAEAAGAGVLVTTDDGFVRGVAVLQPASSVQVKNPVVYEMEVLP